MSEPVQCRLFDARELDFWEFGPGAMHWTTVVHDGTDYRALLIILPCPPDEHPHLLYVEHDTENWSAPGPARGWDGNVEAPTFTPSILCRESGWHGFLTNGRLIEA